MDRRNFLLSIAASALGSHLTPDWARRIIANVAAGRVTLAERLLLEPELIFLRAAMKPDPWQTYCMRQYRNTMSCVSRQRGKTSVAAAKAIAVAITQAPADVIYTARALRQVREFQRRCRFLYNAIRRPRGKPLPFNVKDLDINEKLTDYDWEQLPRLVNDNIFEMKLANGSRIIGIPAKEETVRGYDNIRLVIIDEAARVPDNFFQSVGAFLATTRGTMDVYSTPFGKRGWFYNFMEGEKALDSDWVRVRVAVLGCHHRHHTIPMCDYCRANTNLRMTKSWLAAERRRIGDRWWGQEYETDFNEAVGQLIPQHDINSAFGRSFFS